ncbi:MAG: four helix bundle protein [bacterium]|nr:four helix bundle protein [bacterium]
MTLTSYKELTVWQRSIELVEEIYKLTAKFPKEETYGLVSQLRRAAVAIPSNIAEGYQRGHKAEYIQFLRVAFASSSEVETQLIIAEKLEQTKKLDYSKATNLLEETRKMLNKMISNLKGAKP